MSCLTTTFFTETFGTGGRASHPYTNFYEDSAGNDLALDEIVAEEILTPTPPVLTVTCANPNGSITVTSPTGTDIEYSINNGASYQTSISFLGLAAGTYAVTARNTISGLMSTGTIATIATAPTISAQPISGNTCTGNSFTLSVTAAGATSYQWQSSTDNLNFGNISGATSSTYATGSLSVTTYYRVLVMNGACSLSSSTATVTTCVENCTNGTDDDGDGLIDCADSNCQTSTYAVTVTSQTGVTSSTNATGAPNGAYAQLYDNNDVITLDLGSAIPAGRVITITWRRNTTSSSSPSMAVQFSTDNSTYTTVTGSPFAVSSSSWVTQSITTTASTRYVRITSNNNNNLDLDAIGTTNCTVEVCTNGVDDDSDGLVDCADSGCSAIMANAGSDQSICAGGSALLSASATGGTTPYTYAWSNSLGNASSVMVSPASTTTYTVTISGTNSCTGTDQVVVNVLSDPSISAQPVGFSQCIGGSQSLSVTATGGTPSLAYQWQNSTDNVSFTNISGATASSYTPPSTVSGTIYYRVLVGATGNGCGSATSSSVVVNTLADPAISAQPTGATFCAGGSHTLSVTATGGTPSLTHQWQSSSDNSTFTNISGATASSYTTPALSSTTYYRVVVSATGNGCGSVTSNSATVNVTGVVTAGISGPASICAGSAISLTASGGSSYAWSTSATTASISISPSSTTTYTVTVSDANGCTGTAQLTVTVNSLPSANAGADVSICLGVSPTLTASGGATYVWSDGLGSTASVTASLSATSTYTVTVTTSSGCVATDQVTVTVTTCTEICGNGLDDDADGLTDCADANCAPNAIIGNGVSICSGSFVNLTAGASGGNGTLTYDWSHGLGSGSSKNVSPSSTTTYSVTVTAPSGCTDVASETVTVGTCSENCTDGIDNDADGLLDCADPNCSVITAPVLANDAYTTCPGVAYSERVTYNDGNLQSPVFSIVANPSYGTVSIDWTGKFNYTPNTFECVTDQFTYQACNAAIGCCAQAVVTITMGDNTAPLLLNVPADLTIDCNDAVPTPPLVTGFDNCPAIYMDYAEASSENSTGACDSYAITRTWTATDFCGNSVSDDQIITVTDQTKPEIFRVYTLPNGGKVIAGIAERVTHDWKYVGFPINFSNAPVVLTQLITANESAPAMVRQRNVTRQGFDLRLREEDTANGTHAHEQVAWVAFEAGSHSEAGYEFMAAALSNANHLPDTVYFSPAFGQAPRIFSSLQSTKETTPATPRTLLLTGTEMRLYLQEEQSLDPSGSHANETLGFLALGANSTLRDEHGEQFAEVGSLGLTNAWVTINLTGQYTKPCVIVSGLSNNDQQPLSIRVRNVTASSFQVSLQEWAYLDGSHGMETVNWMVLEGGIPAKSDFYCSKQSERLEAGKNVFAKDNCDYLIDLDYSETETVLADGLKTTRIWSATDDCGNSVTHIRHDTCGVAAVRVKALLGGAMAGNGGSNLMRDNLRSLELVPVVEPYSQLPAFPHVETDDADVVICHHPGLPTQANMTVKESELQEHIDHGDVLGECPPLPASLPPGAAAAQYRTVANGAWASPATWQGGNVPPTGSIQSKSISIEHEVTLPSGEIFLKNNSNLWLTNGSLIVSAGQFRLQNSKIFVNNAYLEITTGHLTTWTGSNTMNFKNCEVKVGADFANESGVRRMENVCMTVGNEFRCGYSGIRDTLINVTGTTGSRIRNYNSAIMYLSNCKFRVLNGHFLNEPGCTMTGDNLTLLLENGSVINTGLWTLPITQHCVSGTVTIPTPFVPALQQCVNIVNLFAGCSSANGNSGNSGNSSNSGNGNSNGTGGNTLSPDLPGPINASRGVIDPIILETTGSQAIVDWMLVELREPLDPTQIVAYATTLMKRDGNIVTEEGDSIILFRGVPANDYYVTIRHRNHLGLRTDSTHFLSLENTPLIDFANPATPVHGGASAGKVAGGKRTMWGGDYNEDGKIIYQGPYNDVFHLFSRVLSDSNNVDYLANFIASGYLLHDFNLDGKVIYQGPNNDRSSMLYYSTLAHPGNMTMLANFIVSEKLLP